jgi:hypothetical protein
MELQFPDTIKMRISSAKVKSSVPTTHWRNPGTEEKLNKEAANAADAALKKKGEKFGLKAEALEKIHEKKKEKDEDIRLFK